MVMLMLRRRVLSRPLRRSALLLHGVPRTSVSAFASHPLLLSLASSRGVASSAAGEDGGELVYEAPLGRSVRLMKGVSVTSCVLTSVGMPTVTMLSQQSASVVAKWAMCGTIMLFGLGTTSLFHLLFKPYVMRMWLAPVPSVDGDSNSSSSDARVTVQTVTLLAGLTKSSFLLSDVRKPEPSMHPMLSFQAAGRSYFIHAECFDDDELLKKFLGSDYKRPARVADDEDDDEDE